MGRKRPKWTDNTPADIARRGRSRITNRWEPCTCGCQGADPWHRSQFDRVVRDVQIHPEPVVVWHPNPEWNLDGRHELARGVAKFPSGIAEVRCCAPFKAGWTAPYAFWERVR